MNVRKPNLRGEKCMPDLNQLKQTISNGDDNQHNRLILLQTGDFRLIPLTQWDENLIYVTRWETFDKGNDYVGSDAANDTRHLQDIMNWALDAWKQYQAKGDLKIINPYS